MRVAMRLLLCGLAGGIPMVFAGAQEAACTPGVLSGGSVGNPGGRGGAFTASVKNTFEQRLIDGNVISGESHTHVYQNSEGWVRTEFMVDCRRDADGKLQWMLEVSIFKPKHSENLHWQEGPNARKEATLYRPVELSAEEHAAQLAKAKAAAAMRSARPKVEQHAKTESLGSATIVGLEATGRRTITTFAPGEEGNSMPLVTTYEYWTTKDGWTVRDTRDDPRRGKTTSEVEELIKGEPDAALFAPPPGYTLKENAPPVVVPVTER